MPGLVALTIATNIMMNGKDIAAIIQDMTGFDLFTMTKFTDHMRVMARLHETVSAIDWNNPIQVVPQ